MYLAGLIGRGAEMTEKELDEWARTATWQMISEYTVPWVAAEHPKAWSVALKWIDAPEEKVAAAGWATLAGVVATRPDSELDLAGVEKLLDRVVKSIRKAPNRTRYAMNGFVIGVGGSVKPLTKKALAAAAKIGRVDVDMGDTECRTPDAAAYIRKIIDSGRHGVKRKTMKC
jgi:hypothetical protein